MKSLRFKPRILTPALLLVVLCSLVAGAQHYQVWGGVDASSTNMINVGTGINPTDGVNLAQMNASNDVLSVAIIAISSSTNGPNQFVKINENGKIDASLIENIVVVFVGGEAVDVQ